jgi:hypothetical protein
VLRVRCGRCDLRVAVRRLEALGGGFRIVAPSLYGWDKNNPGLIGIGFNFFVAIFVVILTQISLIGLLVERQMTEPTK